MKLPVQNTGIDYTPDTYNSRRPPFPVSNESSVSKRVKTPNRRVYDNVRLTVPFKKCEPVILKVYHTIKKSDSALFPQYNKSRIVDSLLLEGSTSTLFTYEITGLKQEGINKVNSLDPYDISGRLKLIEQLQGKILFYRVKYDNLKCNLEMIETKFHVILAHELLYFYRDNISSCKELIIRVADDNPLASRKWGYYTLNKHRFMAALILGLTPDGDWPGHHHAGRAYQILTRSRDVFLFDIEDKHTFHRALVANSQFDFVDPVKVGFGNIYSKDNKSLIDLCLQVSLI